MAKTEAEREVETAIEIPPEYPENEILIDLHVGDYVDCAISKIQAATGKMNSPMLHGVSVPDNMPIKMWCGAYLEQAFKRVPALLGASIRIRRLEDTDTGEASKMKTYRISDLNQLLLWIQKDKPLSSKTAPAKTSS